MDSTDYPTRGGSLSGDRDMKQRTAKSTKLYGECEMRLKSAMLHIGKMMGEQDERL